MEEKELEFSYVVGAEHLYKIYEDGKIISLKDESVKKQNVSKKSGYVTAGITGLGTCYIHRLVAQAFIPNPKNKKCVNHIDANKQNNHVSNLEWCTYKENMEHYAKCPLYVNYSPNGENFKGKNKRKVIDTKTGIIYDSVLEASKKTKIHYLALKRALRGIHINKTTIQYYDK